MGNKGAGEAMRHEHDGFAGGDDGGFEARHPIGASGHLPIALDDPTKMRGRCLPKALPMVRAGIAQPRQYQDGAGHDALLLNRPPPPGPHPPTAAAGGPASPLAPPAKKAAARAPSRAGTARRSTIASSRRAR